MAVCCTYKTENCQGEMKVYKGCTCAYSATLPRESRGQLTCRTRRLTLTRCRQANTQQAVSQRRIRTLSGGGCQTHSAAAEGSFGFLMSFLPPRGAALAVSVAAAPDALGAWPETSAASQSSVRSAGSLISMLLSTSTPKVSCSPSSMLDLEEACSILPRTGASSGQQKTKRIWHAHGCACSAWCVHGA